MLKYRQGKNDKQFIIEYYQNHAKQTKKHQKSAYYQIETEKKLK